MEHSIKARVIALAQKDPYLTVKDLAREAGTTTRYVRTILSEANLSLHEMRRLYARRLERGTGADTQEDLDVKAELTIKKVLGREVRTDIRSWDDRELFLASRLHRHGSLLGYDQLLTTQELRIGVESESQSLRQLLPLGCQKELEVAGHKAEVLPAPEKLGRVLALAQGEQALRLTTVLEVRQEPIALEIRWLGLHGLVLKWSKLEGELEVGLGS